MNYVQLSVTAEDAFGFDWDINRDGSIRDGENDAFDTAFDWNRMGSVDLAIQSGNSFELLPYFDSYNQTLMSRLITVSDTGPWVRYVDTVQNVSDRAVAYTYELRFDFGQDGSTVLNTSSGDTLLDISDTWISVSSSNVNATNTNSGILFGDGSLVPSLSFSYDDFTLEQTVTLAPGEKASFLSFGVQGNQSADVLAVLGDLEDLGFTALDGLDGDILDNLVNWNLDNHALDLEGDASDNRMFGGSVEDRLRGMDGEDTIFAQQGDDHVQGGGDDDLLLGGDGQDTIFGDEALDVVTVSRTTQLANGEDLSISLTMPDRGAGPEVGISGFLSRQPVTSERADVVFAIDVSGSTNSNFVGTRSVGDQNGDGRADTILDAEIAAFEALLTSIIDDARLPDAQITVIPFENDARIAFSGTATQDLNGNGVYDVLETVRGLQDLGGTDFESAMQLAVQHFTAAPDGQRAMYFLSDGGNNQGGPITDDAIALRNLNVQVQAIGVGANAEEADLDLVDDAINNNSATIVLDPDLLSDTLLDPGIAPADISQITVLRNGQVAGQIDPASLTVTPFGLRYFEYTVQGLNVSDDDTIALRVRAADGSNTTLSVSQVLEHQVVQSGDDFIRGMAGSDSLLGGAGDDTLQGGSGADIIDGGAGDDVASYGDSGAALRIDLADMSLNTGDAAGDIYRNIETVRGSAYDDVLSGDSGNNGLSGGLGDDQLFGRAGGDTLAGDEGNDTLFGGEGNDVLFGDNGNDVLFGGADQQAGDAADDVIDGGAGIDTAMYSGQQTSYTLTLSPGSYMITDRSPGGNGTDELLNMEFLDFEADAGTFDLRDLAGQTTLSPEALESFIELYIAYFNRAPDALGLNFWGSKFAEGRTLEQIAARFSASEEASQTYPPGTSTQAFVEAVYNNVLGRQSDAQGLAAWVDKLDSGRLSRDTFILRILDGAKADLKPELGQDFVNQQLADRKYLEDKTDIGAYFAVIRGMSDVEDARDAMGVFDGTEASITAAVAAIDGHYAEALDPVTGDFLMPLVGVLDDPFGGL